MISLYNPFEKFSFLPDECFLTGKKVNPEMDLISVIPQWIIERYQLQDKAIPMLAENAMKYAEIKLPCDPQIAEEFIHPMEAKIESAFQSGYAAVKDLPPLILFQWIGKFVYGMLYNDIVFGMKQYARKEKVFSLSPYLIKNFTAVHQMLQSLIFPMEFEVTPWSLIVAPIESTKDIFNYKDETKNVNFSLAMNDFGIIMCLQDGGRNIDYHRDLLEKIKSKTLHPIQFEELWSRFLYSNYLLKTKPEFDFTINEDKIIVADLKSEVPSEYDKWDDKMYAQVLANYWKPWGIALGDIYSFPNSPISFLIDEYTNEFIEKEKIEQPY